MTTALMDNPLAKRSLRLWPGVLAVTWQWLSLAFLVNQARTDPLLGAMVVTVGVYGGAVVGILWWLFFSQAPWMERVGALILMPLALFMTLIATWGGYYAGSFWQTEFVDGSLILCLALLVWAVLSQHLATVPRRVALVAVTLLACGVFTAMIQKWKVLM